jgi:hypothetical protein
LLLLLTRKTFLHFLVLVITLSLGFGSLATDQLGKVKTKSEAQICCAFLYRKKDLEPRLLYFCSDFTLAPAQPADEQLPIVVIDIDRVQNKDKLYSFLFLRSSRLVT